MTIDLIVLGLVLFFTLWGAMTGLARQLARYVALVVAFLGAGPLGRELAPRISTALSSPKSVGVAVGSVVAFVFIFFVTQLVVTALIRRLLSDEAPTSIARDRSLGALAGGLRGAVLCYLLLCAAVYIEHAVVIGGKTLSFGPKGSYAFALAERYNVLELRQFQGAESLVAVAKKASGAAPSGQGWSALLNDPRFKRLLEHKPTREAIQHGEVRTLLKNDAAVELLNDEKTMAVINRLQTENAPETGP